MPLLLPNPLPLPPPPPLPNVLLAALDPPVDVVVAREQLSQPEGLAALEPPHDLEQRHVRLLESRGELAWLELGRGLGSELGAGSGSGLGVGVGLGLGLGLEQFLSVDL